MGEGFCIVLWTLYKQHKNHFLLRKLLTKTNLQSREIERNNKAFIEISSLEVNKIASLFLIRSLLMGSLNSSINNCPMNQVFLTYN